MNHKRTVARTVSLSGIGIHSGQPVRIRLLPHSGGEIVFRRMDLDGLDFPIEPRAMAARRSSNLVQGSHHIMTVEHFMAALAAFSVDSVLIELDGEEIPILDGSARPFAEALTEAGSLSLNIPREPLIIRRPFALQENGASLHVAPFAGLRISYRIDFDHPAIGVQERSFVLNRRCFVEDIAPARTFGFLKDVPDLRARRLALGGALDNALVLDDEGVINGPLRFPDEFVRHKILDLCGDLALLGRPIHGHFKADRAGHGLHLRTVEYLLDHPELLELS